MFEIGLGLGGLLWVILEVEFVYFWVIEKDKRFFGVFNEFVSIYLNWVSFVFEDVL